MEHRINYIVKVAKKGTDFYEELEFVFRGTALGYAESAYRNGKDTQVFNAHSGNLVAEYIHY